MKLFQYLVILLTNLILAQPGLFLIESYKFCLAQYLDFIYQKFIFSIITRSARIKYYEPKQKIKSANLPSTINDLDILSAKLESQIVENRLTEIIEFADYFICSSLSLTFKFNSKWRKIYHLSYPRGSSINCHIPKKYGEVEYINFDQPRQ